MAKKSKVTVTDIAKRVNMTTVTVSRALNKPEKVKKETLERILAVAKELNYVPNAFARNLKNRESRLIGVITASLDNPFYGDLIKAISREAKKQDYSILLFDTDGSPELEQKAVETLLSYQVAGIILSVVSDGNHYQPSYLSQLANTDIPVVQVDRKLANAPFPGVYLENQGCGYTGGKALMDAGHRHILAVAGPENSHITQLRLAGIRQALVPYQDAQLDILYGDYTREPACAAVAHYLQQGNRPDVIFGLNILITLGCLQGVAKAGVPKTQIDFFSIDEVPYSDLFDFRIPCVAHDTYQLGHKAIAMLLQRLKDPDFVPEDQTICGELRLNEAKQEPNQIGSAQKSLDNA